MSFTHPRRPTTRPCRTTRPHASNEDRDMVDRAARHATYQDVLDAPANQIAELIDGVLRVSRGAPSPTPLRHRPWRRADPAVSSGSRSTRRLVPPRSAGAAPRSRRDGPRSRRMATRAHAGADGRRTVLHPGTRLDLRGPVTVDRQARSRREASDLCARPGPARVARRSRTPHARAAPARTRTLGIARHLSRGHARPR